MPNAALRKPAKLAHYLMFDLNRSITRLPGATPVRAELVEHSLAYLDRLSSEKIRDPVLRTEVGEGYAQLASILGNPATSNIGQPARARQTWLRAIAILTPEANGGNRRARLILANTKIDLGRLLDFESNSGRASIEWATRTSRVSSRPGPAITKFATTPDGPPRSCVLSARLPAAISPGRTPRHRSRRLRHPSAMPKPPRASIPAEMPSACSPSTTRSPGSITELRDPAGATHYFRQGVAAMDRIPAADRYTPIVRSNRSSAPLGLGRNLGHLGHFDEAFRYLEEARQLRDRAAAADPDNIQSLYLSALPYYQLADLFSIAGKKGRSKKGGGTSLSPRWRRHFRPPSQT